MTYIDEIIARIEDELGVGVVTSQRELYRFYAVLVLTKGRSITPPDVHDAWAAWKSAIDPTDPDVAPFDALTLESQKKDEPFVDVLIRVASKLDAARHSRHVE